MRAITHRRSLSGWVVAALAAVLIAGGGTAGYFYATRSNNPVPKDVMASIDFSPLVLSASTTKYTAADYKYSEVEANVKVLSYIVRSSDGTSVTISQYIQPTEFGEIPEYKDRFLTNIAKQYATVGTTNGTVYLGRMAKQNDAQLAVMLEKGLIIFMNPDKELPESQWRDLVNNLDIYKD